MKKNEKKCCKTLGKEYGANMENTYRIECRWPAFPFFSPRVVKGGLTKEQAETDLALYVKNADNGQTYHIEKG